MEIRDRVRELRRVKASELAANPKNWRTHPQAQKQALEGVLAEVGYTRMPCWPGKGLMVPWN